MKARLFKRSIAVLIVGIMLIAALPVSATVTEGRWVTISRIDMNDFTWTDTKQTDSGMIARKTYNERGITVGVDGRYTAPWCIHEETRFFNSLTSGVYANKPAGVGGTVLVMPRKYTTAGGWVNSSSAFTVDNIFDKSMVKVGDKLRITAWVYTTDMVTKAGDDGDEPVTVSDQANATSTARMWITDDDNYSKGEPSYERPAEGVTVTIPNQKWQEISIEYPLNETNININRIRIDSDYVQIGQDYPLTFILGAVTTEVYREDIPEGAITEKLADENMDGFSWSGDAANGYVVTKTKTDGTTMQIDINGKGETPSHIHSAIEFNNATHNILTSRPKAWGTNVLVMYRNWASPDFPSSASGFKVKNLFDTDELKIGDVVTVNAWIYTQDMSIVDPNKTINGNDTRVMLKSIAEERETNATSFVRMWLSKEDTYNSSNPSATKCDESVTKEIGSRKWEKVSFTYTVDEENKNIGDIRIDSGHTVLGDICPHTFILGNLEVEVARVNDGTEVNTYTIDEAGKLSGTVNVTTDDVSDNKKVIVAAYKDGFFTGCYMTDYNDSGVFDFEIGNASGVDGVKAYIWSMDSLTPCIEPVPLTMAQ